MAEFEHVASIQDLPPDGRLAILVDDTPALLIHQGNEFYAIEDVCSHDGQPLTDGLIENCSITCPRHGAKFDLRTGNPLCMPAVEGIRTFEVQTRDGGIYVRPRP